MIVAHKRSSLFDDIYCSKYPNLMTMNGIHTLSLSLQARSYGLHPSQDLGMSKVHFLCYLA